MDRATVSLVHLIHQQLKSLLRLLQQVCTQWGEGAVVWWLPGSKRLTGCVITSLRLDFSFFLSFFFFFFFLFLKSGFKHSLYSYRFPFCSMVAGMYLFMCTGAQEFQRSISDVVLDLPFFFLFSFFFFLLRYFT